VSVNPPGTIVCIDGKQAGTSPMVAKLSRKQDHVLLFERPGYKPAALALRQQVNPWIVGNFFPIILIPGPIGFIVVGQRDAEGGDPARLRAHQHQRCGLVDRAVHELEPKQATFTLTPDDSAGARPARQPCDPL
jgi:hypothetical protein